VSLPRKLAAEALGTFLLVATVVGSGIMADRLAGGNDALALLANSLATGAILVVLILVFGPLSGAHFNPAVTFHFVLTCRMRSRDGGFYVLVQTIGAIAGTLAAHAMFGEALVQAATTARSGGGQWLGEFVATFALLAAIVGVSRHKPEAVPYAVGLVIVAGYWYTSSTSFANPAVTLARSLTDTFTGIRPADVAPFIAMQLVGGLAATLFFKWLYGWRSAPDCARAFAWTCEARN
jgi:glycerol uptake facilitator-like aquaporin